MTTLKTSKLKGLQDALRESESRYRRLLASVSDFIFTVKLQAGPVESFSYGEGCVAVTGYTPDELAGDPGLRLMMIPEEERAFVVRHMRNALTGCVYPPIEHRIFRKDGGVRWVKNMVIPYFGADGVLLSYDVIMTDVTERKNIEEQLYHAQKMEAMGRLAAGVAHDFNNCLNGIMGFAELSMRLVKHPEKVYANLELILDTAERAAEITRRLLAFNRKRAPEQKVLNVSAAAAGVEKILGRLIGEDIELKTSFPMGVRGVLIDPTHVQQILINLALNARDAMPGGGGIIMQTRNVDFEEDVEDGPFRIPRGEYVAISVSDSGVGLSEHVRARLFEPFFTTKAAGSGTGLGLSIVHGIVAQCGGRISVRGEEGKGCTFTIYLPAVEEAAAAEDKKRDIFDGPTGSETILVVEDNSIVRESVMRILHMHGYTVFEADHGSNALSVLEKNGGVIDLVLTDVIMPHMSGPELVKKLRNSGRNVRTLFMSGYEDSTSLHHGIIDIGRNFIGKPFSADALLKKVREIIECEPSAHA